MAEELGEDPHMVARAREIPGFGGYWYESPGGRLVVALTESSAAGSFPVARRAVLARLAADVTHASSLTNEWIGPPPEVVERVVEYSFIELARHRARLRALFGVPDVVSLAVDEELNRVVIGLEDPSSKVAVLAFAAELAVPVEVIAFSQESRARMLSMSSGESPPPLSPSEGAGTLRRPIADGKLRGGYQVEADGGKICTLGFTAVLDSGGLVFVSNSHCSKIPWSTDFGDWGQPKSDDTVGVEVDDPPTRRCGILRRKCRDSDASMMAVNAGVSIALGEIGRTTERNRDCTIGSGPGEVCSISIDSEDPTIRITSVQTGSAKNDVLDKIGSTTGWTSGIVKETCKDITGKTGVKILCADEVHFLTGLGDSGAPVFKYSLDRGTAQFRGILFTDWDVRKSDSLGRKAAFQDLEQIEWDLGALTVMDPGSPRVEVLGRTLVKREEKCTWTAYTRRGLEPFTYEWSGVLHGSGRTVTGVVRESGWLRVTVTDPLDRTDRDSLEVRVGGGARCRRVGGVDPGDDTVRVSGPPSGS